MNAFSPRAAVVVAVLVVATLAAASVGATASVDAAPQQRKISIYAQADNTYNREQFQVDPGEELEIELTNLNYMGGSHDIVFELDGGRVERSRVLTAFLQTDTIEFAAPTALGGYVYYSSVGSQRQQGMEGTMWVGDPPAETEEPTPTATPTEEPPPVDYTTVLDGLLSPRGLSVFAGGGSAGPVAFVGEGGTAGEATGEAAPGNSDGRVHLVPLGDTDLSEVLIDELTNAQRPAGGVFGANHAIWWERQGQATRTATVALAAIAGGPGHEEPDEAAKVLDVGADGSSQVLADPLQYEKDHNPDGGEIASDPWRLVPHGDHVYVVDSGANTILKMDPDTGALSTYAVFEPVAGGVPAEPSGLVFLFLPEDDGTNRAVATLLASQDAEAGQVRLLVDNNGDGDALDEGENTVLFEGLSMPVDIAMNEGGDVFVLELGKDRLIYAGGMGGGHDDPLSAPVAVVDKLYGCSGLAFEPSGDLLVSIAGAPGPGEITRDTDRIVRVPADALEPGPTPTSTSPTNTPGPTEPTPTATAARPTPTPDGQVPVYLPIAEKP